MDKYAAAHVLEQIASHLELKGDNEFRVRAYRSAAQTVAAYPGDVAEAVRSGNLGDERGIGPATMEIVAEVLASGRSRALEALKREVPEGLVEMLRISGLGVQKVRAIHEQLGITTVAELEGAARNGRLAALPRFGDKTARKILRGIEYLRRAGTLHLFHHAWRQADHLVEGIRRLPGVTAAEVAGSVRRRCELVRDVDLVVGTTRAPRDISEQLARFTGVKDVVGIGETAFTVHFDDGIPTDVYVAPPGRFGFVLVRATGNFAHLEHLAAVGRERSLMVGRDALLRAGEPLDAPDEAAVYGQLGLPWIPPELRECRGEVALAREGKLPVLVERDDLLGLLHCHTVFSDGTNTLAEVADACEAAGYSYVGITDHSEHSEYTGGLTEEVILRQHEEIDACNRKRSGIRVLKGIEADILPDGRLDYGPDFLGRFDFVIGSVHTGFDMDEGRMTSRVLRALDDPHLAILGHPTGRLLLDREAYPLDMHRVIERAAERGAAIEINADPQRLDMDWRLCGEASAAGVPIPIGADAHSVAGLANVDLGVGIARKGGLTKADVLNARDLEGFLSHVEKRRGGS
jgi:DNA polymerase (family 10)